MPWPINFCFLDAYSQSKFIASVEEPVYQLLHVFHCMSHQCSINCEKHFSDDDMSHFCFGADVLQLKFRQYPAIHTNYS